MSNDLVLAAQAKYGLTEQQAALALAFAEKGTLADAARSIDFPLSEAKSLARRSAAFVAAVREALDLVVARDAVRARRAIYQLMEKAESETVRLQAAKALKEWAVGQAPQHHIHEHRFAGDPAAVRDRIKTLMSELGMSGEVIEGEIVPDG